jgi:hypothetical protein
VVLENKENLSGTPNNVEAQHFDVINCSSGGMLFGSSTYIFVISDA